MSSWKSIIAGREDDVYFLLKELVEDREIAKAIGDFKGLSGPKKEGEDEEDKRSLKERLEDFSKDRAEQRTQFEGQLQALERGIKNNQPDLEDIVNEIFFSDMIVGVPTSETKEINYLVSPKTIETETQTIGTSGVSFQENKFKKRIKEALKDLYRGSDERKDEKFPMTDEQFDLFAEENFETIKQHISRGLAVSLGLRASRKDLELNEKEAEKEVESRKKYLEKTKTERKEKSAKLEKQIKALEKLAKERGKLKADKITSVVPIINATYENEVDNEKIADILDLPKKPIFDSAEEANDFIVSFNKVQRKRNELEKRLKKIKDKEMSKGKYEEKDEFARRKRKRDRSISGMEKAITRLNKTLKEQGVKVTQIKQFRDLLSMNLDSKIKSLKGKLNGLSQELELAERRVELAVLRAASVIDEDDPLYNKKRQEMFKNLEVLGKDIKVDLSKKGIEDRIKQENLKAFNSDKKKALETFDKTTKVIEERIKASFKQKEEDKLIAEGKAERRKTKESVAFSEIFSEIEGKPALKTIKELLNEEGFKQYLSILDKKIVIEGEKIGAYKKMTAKQKNDFILDNMPKFKEYYTRLMRALDDLQVKTPTEDKKITKVKKLMAKLQSRFKMTKEEKEKRKKSPLRYGAQKTADFEGKSKAGIKQVVKEQLAAEEKMLYGYFFERARVDSAKKQEALLTSDVGAQTRKFWTELSSNMDAFSKAASNYQSEDDFVKAIQSFIGKNNLHVIDILNLMGTKRNNKVRSDILDALQKNKFIQDLTRAKKEAPVRYTRSGKKKKETLEQKIARQKKEGGRPKRYEPKDPRFSEKESMLKSEIGSDKESMDKRMLDWGKLKLEDAVKLAKKIRGAEDSDEFDTSNKRLHTFFTKEKGKEDKNRFFAFVDVNRKAEVVVRGFSYKKGDKGYNEIEKAADSILKNLEKEVTFEGQEMTILEVINRISRNTLKYKAGRVDSDTKDDVREQFGKLVEEAIKNVKMKKSEQFRIPKFFKSRMKEDAKVFRNDIMNLQPFLAPAIQRSLKPIFEEYININERIIIGAEVTQKAIFDIYEKINSTPKEEPKEKDIDTIAEEMMMQSSIYARKERQLNRLLNRFEEMEKKIESELEVKRKFLLGLQKRINEKIKENLPRIASENEEEATKGKAQQKIVSALQDTEEIIREEVSELEKGAEYRLKQHIDKFMQFTKKEKAENKRLIESMESGEGKRTKRGIKVPAKEEDE